MTSFRREDMLRADDGPSCSNGVWFTPLSPMSETGTPRTAADGVIRGGYAADQQLSSSPPGGGADANGCAFALASASPPTPLLHAIDAAVAVVPVDSTDSNDSEQAHFAFHFGESFELPDLGFLDAIGGDNEAGDAVVQEAAQSGSGEGGDVTQALQVTNSTLADPGPSAVRVIPSGVSDSNHNSTLEQQPQQRKEIKLKRIRKCVKRELEYLQVQVEALEQQLQVLQSARGAGTSRNSDAFGAMTTPSRFAGGSGAERRALPSKVAATATLPGLWERIARNQMDEKRKSEEENAKLREMLEGQIKVANSLARVLKKRPNVSWLNDSKSKRVRIQDDATALSTSSLLVQIVDSLYAQLDTVFANAIGTQNTQLDARDVQVSSDAHGRVQMEFFTSKAFPFDVSTTAAVAWKLAGLSLGNVSNGYYAVRFGHRHDQLHCSDVFADDCGFCAHVCCQALESTDSVVRSQASGTLCILHKEVGLHCDILIQKVVEEDRVVILWCVLGGSDDSKTVAAPKILIRETGWAVIKEVLYDARVLDTSPRTSVTQSVVHVAPEFSHNVAVAPGTDGDDDGGAFQPGLLTDVIMGAYLQNMSAVHQNMENLLMSEALSSKVVSV